jgi:hypothetical protein
MNRPARPDAWYLLAAGQAVYLVGNVCWFVVAAAGYRDCRDGAIAGLYPAMRAACLSPTEAVARG